MNIINVNWNRMTETFGKRLHRGGTRGHNLYMMKNDKGEVIRIGACNNLNERMNVYKNGYIDNPRVYEETTTVEYMLVKSRELLLDLEKKAIKSIRPIYNVRGK